MTTVSWSHTFDEMIFESKEILITVKAYPNPSQKYGETVCVAGVELMSKNWIRLYPVPFRDLDDERKFPKYSVIKADVFKARDDHRPESYKVNADSIRVIGYYGSERNWARRKEMLLPTQSSSFCNILRENSFNRKSLGMFKPQNVDFSFCKARKRDEKAREQCYAQTTFFNKEKNAPEAIPYEFRFSFSCEGECDCPGHSLSIIDWEIGQSYRSWRIKYQDEDVLLQKIKEKWLGMCAADKDTFFFIGNIQRLPHIFMILGVFYPPKTIEHDSSSLLLFDH
jgi:hypothetical protein